MTAAAPGAWVAHAACAKHTDAMTMPSEAGAQGTVRNRQHIERARTICHSCPVLAECREWALSTPDPARDMIAGGLIPRERGARRRGRS